MSAVSYRQRLRTVGAALGRERELRAQARWSREQLAAHQQRRLDEIVRHAAERSAVYRERFAAVDLSPPVRLADLPPVTKDELMERFDSWVTDPRLRRADVEAHLGALDGDELLHGEYRVMATGGSTGRRGVFAYGPAEWAEFCAIMLRAMRTFGITPKLPRHRFATVMAPSSLHMTWRLGASIDVGMHRRLALAATDPLPSLVEALNRFRPTILATYPSVAALLADEQLQGRLRIAPANVGTSSEVCTPEMRERIRSAWGIEPHEVYGATDGLWGSTCEHHRLHFAEDETIVEVEDDRILVTNLFLRTQPVIRYEITDLVRLDPEPCPCGRPFRTVSAIEGRSDDVLRLPGGVTIHPLRLRSPMAKLDGVRQYQLVHRDDGLHALVVARPGHDVRDPVRLALQGALGGALRVHVEVVDAIPRENGAAGKFKLVRSEARVPALS
jgi:phenylacetate-coenzyme A ligase PaaK-like adenylate-forming protein